MTSEPKPRPLPDVSDLPGAAALDLGRALERVVRDAITNALGDRRSKQGVGHDEAAERMAATVKTEDGRCSACGHDAEALTVRQVAFRLQAVPAPCRSGLRPGCCRPGRSPRTASAG